MGGRGNGLAKGLLLALCVGATTVASAVDGCKVLLCLASPGGPRQYAACVPPIDDFFKSIALGGSPFPKCDTAGNPQTHTGSYAAPMPSNYYDQCPAGTTALPSGSYAIMAPNWVRADSTRAWVSQQTLYAGIGEGTSLNPAAGAPPSSLPAKVCVSGAPLARVNYGGFGRSARYASVYASVTILQPNTSRNVMGVWINGSLYNQVHY